MTKKDFFAILIKIFALLSLISSIFTVIPNGVSYIFTGINMKSAFWIIGILVITLALFLFCLFKAELIVKFLKLDKGFDNDLIDFGNLKPNEIIKIGVFIIGGLLIINSLPQFLSYAFFAFKFSLANSTYEHNEKFNWVISGLKLLLGYLLLTNYNSIGKKFQSDNKTE